MTPLDKLRELHPWPAQRPTVAPSERGWDGGGREIVADLIRERQMKVVLEIGTFLGLSARKWLHCAADLAVIAIDPWISPKPHEWTESWALKGWPEIHHKDVYELFLSSNWDYRQRLIPVRGPSPQRLQAVFDCGVKPDMIYVDGDHSYDGVMRDLTESYRLFPDAVLTGDDWKWDKEFSPPRSVREAVVDFSEARDWSVHFKQNTWVLVGSGAPCRERRQHSSTALRFLKSFFVKKHATP